MKIMKLVFILTFFLTSPHLSAMEVKKAADPAITFLTFESISDLVRDLEQNAQFQRIHVDDDHYVLQSERPHDVLALLFEARKEPFLLLRHINCIFKHAAPDEILRQQITPQLVAAIIKHLGIDVEQPNPKKLNQRLLHQAVTKNMIKQVIDTLCFAGALVNAPDDFGSTALHLAAYHGHVDACQVLLDHKAAVDPDTRYDNMTPLHFAARRGSDAICQILVDAKADVNRQDTKFFGRAGRRFPDATPLHYAIHGKHKEVILTLTKSGSDFTIKDALDKAPYQEDGCSKVIAKLEVQSGAAAQSMASIKPLNLAPGKDTSAADNSLIQRLESCVIN